MHGTNDIKASDYSVAPSKIAILMHNAEDTEQTKMAKTRRGVGRVECKTREQKTIQAQKYPNKHPIPQLA